MILPVPNLKEVAQLSFLPNDPSQQQLSFLDPYNTLTDREKKALNQSWAKYFFDHIFSNIDEMPYAVLYSDKESKPNTPVNIQVGALIIKELLGLSDEEFMNALMFDIRFQYALHTTSYIEQPLSVRTLSRFRERCSTYKKESGIDLLCSTLESLSDELNEILHVDHSLRRVDSLTVCANIEKMNQLELLYNCVSNLVKEIHANGDSLPEELVHYTQTDDRNGIINHNRSEETTDKINTLLADAQTLKSFCGSEYDESSCYQLLLRVLKEHMADGASVIKST